MAEEFVYLVDENNKILGKVSRKEMRAKNLLHRGVRFFIINSRGEILITKRTDTKDVYPGLLEANQAGCLTYGETEENAVKREIEEETGIKDSKVDFLFDYFFEDKKNRGFAKVYKCVYDGPITPQKEEVADYFFISAEKLKKMIGETPEKFTPDSLGAFKKYLS